MSGLPELLQEARAAARLSYRELGRRLGVSHAFAHELCVGSRPVPKERLRGLSEVLGIELGEVLAAWVGTELAEHRGEALVHAGVILSTNGGRVVKPARRLGGGRWLERRS